MLGRVTVNVRVPSDDAVLKTIKIYNRGLQHCIDVAWKKRIRNNIKLHPFVYKEIRGFGLQSQLAVACIKQACGMVKRAKSKPAINSFSMRYNSPRSFSFKHGILGLSTIEGRKKFNITLPEYAKKYIAWEIDESVLWSDRKNRIFFGLCLSKDIDIPIRSAQHRQVLGVDVGIKHLAVTSDGKFYGTVIPKMRRHQEHIASLQSKGTKSARRHLKKVSGRWKRFMRWKNHNISREIVNSLGEGSIVALEGITNIRSNKGRKFNRQLHSWAFRQLQSYIEYKAIQRGCLVAYINPRYTSQTCRICNEIGTRNKGFFLCNSCGYSCNADLNASFNIKNRVKPLAMAFGLNVNQPIVASGGFLNVKHFESPDLSYNAHRF
ncbi:MAG: IS200/IS605 family element transposase accessory protein TnpB [Candidatus Aenigmarchaeota archaeon]|nr:IS200/IS605 family element transposase accessory protein TnpB [Candidatus Aenigmarchaeota archaeon]